MATEITKRCDIYDTKRDVITVEVTVVEVLGEPEPVVLQNCTPSIVSVSQGGIADEAATIRPVRQIKGATLDVSPKALERLLSCVTKGTTPPGGKGA